MSAPLFWIAGPSLAALALYFGKESRFKHILFLGINLFFLLLTYVIVIDPIGDTAFYQIPLQSGFNVLGRRFILAESDIFLVQLIHLFNIIWGIFGNFYQRENRLIPLGMLFTSMLLGAYTVTPFLYASLIIEIAVILSVPLLTKKNTTTLDGVARYLIYQSLAIPFILLAGWFLAGGEITPVNPEQLVQATLLLGIGFILWIGVFPFHTWIPLMYRDLNPFNLGYVLQLLILILFLIILKFIDGFTWLRQYELFYDAFLLLGVIMAGLGALGVAFQKYIQELAGYIFIHMIGMMLIAIGLFANTNIIPFSSIFAIFIIYITTIHIMVAHMRSEGQDIPIESTGKENENFIALIGFAFSLLSITGMPLTLGFPAMQWINQELAATNKLYLWIMMLGKILIVFTAIRMVKTIYTNLVDIKEIFPQKTNDWLLLGFIALVIIAGFFPNFVFAKFDQLISGFENLIQ